MADTSDLKHMVMSFRVSELQVLLGFAGRNKSGRKQELMQRALVLVEKGCSTAIHIKIRDLYRRRFPPKAGASPSKAAPPMLSGSSGASSGISSPSKAFSPYGGPCPYGSTKGSSSSTSVVPGGPLDFSSKHSTMSSPSTSPHNQVPVHPDVRFKRLPFYDLLGELLKPSSLVPRSQSRFQETFFIFHLTPQQAQDIAMSRDTQIGGRVDYTVQIQLRFCLLETSCPQEDNFPPSICVRVNGKMAPLPNPIPTNKPGVEPKRPSRPVNITTICRISPTVPNHINISWASELGRSYCVAVYLVRRLSSDILLQRLKHNGIKHPDHTRALIKEKLAHDPDSEIVTSSLRISLACPLGKMRMTIPSRASTCNHLQCFDAPMYLQMNEKKPTWLCPVCDKAAEFDNLFVDGLFTEILRKESDVSEIKFLEDGSWHPMKEKEVESVPSSPIIQSIEDSPNPKKPTPKEETSDVIDLTETDDEEEDVMAVTSVADSSAGSSPPASPALSPNATSVISKASSSSGGDMPILTDVDAAIDLRSHRDSPSPISPAPSLVPTPLPQPPPLIRAPSSSQPDLPSLTVPGLDRATPPTLRPIEPMDTDMDLYMMLSGGDASRQVAEIDLYPDTMDVSRDQESRSSTDRDSVNSRDSNMSRHRDSRDSQDRYSRDSQDSNSCDSQDSNISGRTRLSLRARSSRASSVVQEEVIDLD